MKVNEILTESTKPTFTGDFPIAMKTVEAGTAKRYAAKLKDYIPTMQAGIEAGEILNTQMEGIKSVVNDFVKAAFDGYVDYEPVRNRANPQDTPLFDELYGALSAWDLRGMIASHKRLLKVSKEAKATAPYKQAIELCDELQPLVKVMEYLKSVTVKASVKKAEAKAAKDAETATYQKKFTDHKDVKKVVAILKGKAKEVEDGIFERQVKILTGIVERFKKALGEDGTADYADVFKNDPFSKYTMQSLAERVYPKNYSHRDPKKFKLIDGWKKKVDEMAKRTAAEIVDHFVYKNSGKLSYILYTKDNMKDVELKNVSLNKGAVEAQLHCVFKDGSEFLADSSVVFAVSHLGTPFYRYPTTFRNVMLPDGSKMGQPSEQRMDEVFAVTK